MPARLSKSVRNPWRPRLPQQIALPLGLPPAGAPTEYWLVAGGRRVPLRLARNRRARRYILRLSPDGSARVTVPRGGSVAQAMEFAHRNTAWLERELLRLATRPSRPKAWPLGTEVLFRGQPVRLEAGANGQSGLVCFGQESLHVPDATGDLRPAVEGRLRALAAQELPARALELAAVHLFPVRRVSVRDQRSRWGSCSRRGTVSLNWRLVQAPSFVRDYLILHELVHLREMNHSSRFWLEVSRLCPQFAEAERWLKEHSELLR
jgi:predicted metal-dependent hydrolase